MWDEQLGVLAGEERAQLLGLEELAGGLLKLNGTKDEQLAVGLPYLVESKCRI